MKAFFLRMFLFAFLAAGAFSSAAANVGPIEASVWIDVVRDRDVTFNGYRLPREGVGSGVAISAREIVTAAHVVQGAMMITVYNVEGKTFSASIVGIDPSIDRAVLRVHEKDRMTYFAPVRTNPAMIGEKVSVVSWIPMNVIPRVSFGRVETVNLQSNGIALPLIFSGIKGEKGQSGGGLFDEQGALVGIIVRIDARLGYLNSIPAGGLCSTAVRCASGTK